MKRVAVFLDAGYFWVQLSTLFFSGRMSREALDIDYVKMREVVLKEAKQQFPDSDLLRVYWYDGPGSGDKGKMPSHLSIDDLDDFKLRMGTRNGLGQQKAVDGLIIADMISLTQSKAITDSLLITGDADMTPGVVAAQALGLRVHLLSIGAGAATSPHLAAEVDRKFSWGFDDVSIFAKPASLPMQVPVLQSVVPQTVRDQLDCGQIAQSVLDDLRRRGEPLLSGLNSSSNEIPREIDKLVLAAGREQIDRSLNENERRELRKKFKSLLSLSKSIPKKIDEDLTHP